MSKWLAEYRDYLKSGDRKAAASQQDAVWHGRVLLATEEGWLIVEDLGGGLTWVRGDLFDT